MQHNLQSHQGLNYHPLQNFTSAESILQNSQSVQSTAFIAHGSHEQPISESIHQVPNRPSTAAQTFTILENTSSVQSTAPGSSSSSSHLNFQGPQTSNHFQLLNPTPTAAPVPNIPEQPTTSTVSSSSHQPLFGATCFSASTVRVQRSPSIVIPLKNWLKKSTKGEQIIEHFGVFGNLISKLRGELANFVISREIDGLNFFPKISADRYLELAKEIKDLFHSESIGSYYTPRVPKTEYSKAQNAKGKLLQAYDYMKKLERVRQEKIEAQKKKENTIIVDTEAESSNKEKLEFLEKELEPWPQVVAFWRDTWSIRKDLLKNLGIHEYFERFPCLKQPLGINLVS